MAIYLKVDGVTGGVTDGKHKQQIELLDASWNMTRSIRSAVGVGSNRESTSASVGELTFTKFVDEASAKLLQYAFAGTSKTYTLSFTRVGSTVRQDGEDDFRTIELTEGIISGLTNSGHGRDRPTEVFRINFSKIEITDVSERESGSTGDRAVASYDLTSAKAG